MSEDLGQQKCHSDQMGPGRGGGRGEEEGAESWHLSAVMVGGICKHVLESVGFGEQEPDLFVPPVYRGQVL